MYAEAWGRFWSWGHRDEINIVVRPHSNKGMKRKVQRREESLAFWEHRLGFLLQKQTREPEPWQEDGDIIQEWEMAFRSALRVHGTAFILTDLQMDAGSDSQLVV